MFIYSFKVIAIILFITIQTCQSKDYDQYSYETQSSYDNAESKECDKTTSIESDEYFYGNQKYEDDKYEFEEKVFRKSYSGFLPDTCFPPDYYDDFSKHPCDRQCIPGEKPQLCYYKLSLSSFETHNPQACSRYCHETDSCNKCILTDGIRSKVQVMNYKLPSPAIVACYNDYIIVDVANHLDNSKENSTTENAITRRYSFLKKEFQWNKVKDPSKAGYKELERYYRKVIRTFKRVGEPTTIHWHGILQKKVLIQDGVPNVTQQAIPRDSVYRYKFIADNSGTLFYHSHFGEQRAFGLAGPLIIREAKDPNAHLYDYDLTEHIVFIQDFGYDFQPDEPDTMLINGKGIQQTGNAGEPHIFEVEPYKRYRFRMVFNGIINMKVTVWIRDLKMKVIALDGHAIEARDISSFMLASGERLDVVVSFGKERKQPYWLHAKGAGRSSVGQIAMIKFKEMPTKSWTLQEFQNMNIPQGIQLAETAFATVDSKESAISAHKMFAIEKIPLNLRAPKCKYVFLEQAVGTQGFQINQITMKFPNVAYQNQVFSQTAYLDQENFCSIDQLGKNRCLNETCNCEQVIKVSMNTCYDVVILGAHPFHLHGHIFYIVAEGTLPANVTITKELFLEMESKNQIVRNLVNPPIRDMALPNENGYLVLRVFFDNPGFNAAHCHIEPHSFNGMFAVFMVGTESEIFHLQEPHPYHNYKPKANNYCASKVTSKKH